MTTCQRTGCTRVGTHHPVLLLRPQGHPEADPAEFVLGILVCPEHQAVTGPMDLIHPTEGWTYLDQVMDGLGLARLDRENVGLAWRRRDLVPFPRPQQ